MENTHIHSSFDNDLNKLNDNLLKLGNTALEQFDNCINNFGTQNLEEIEKVVGGDTILDDLDDRVQKLGFEIIALRAPQAADLRRIIVALKIATIFERIGDYSRNISNRTKLLIELNYSDLPGVNIGKMGQKTLTMMEDVIESYVNEDDKLAVARARKVERFLSQPFFVAEVFTGSPGKYVSLEDSIKGFNGILNGDYDDLPEQAFYMVGTIEEAVEKAKTM